MEHIHDINLLDQSVVNGPFTSFNRMTFSTRTSTTKILGHRTQARKRVNTIVGTLSTSTCRFYPSLFEPLIRWPILSTQPAPVVSCLDVHSPDTANASSPLGHPRVSLALGLVTSFLINRYADQFQVSTTIAVEESENPLASSIDGVLDFGLGFGSNSIVDTRKTILSSFAHNMEVARMLGWEVAYFNTGPQKQESTPNTSPSNSTAVTPSSLTSNFRWRLVNQPRLAIASFGPGIQILRLQLEYWVVDT